ncbi:uncharacterized protein DSM5745_06811 [Aspergillus mulundensis]|uniref:F-box domain-containing protein n=1 Tax=Aspergillus mulundensis TaxID=1810919 RepID=A0A3D8RS07_9EURO|nr:hypothetical protein DSM5745_06811 [Aspergillus mulundensis]RDW76819.1 hypothetical protein DSM5745_06811 [Aspergillus mulundensis]
MPRKRKITDISRDLPAPAEMSIVTTAPANTACTDPLRLLPVECVSMIFQYLDASDLVRCERISTSWQDYLRNWMAVSGLRLRFPAATQPKKTGDPSEAVKLFKSCAALTTGEPTAVRTMRATSHCVAVAGNFMAWKEHETIFWKDLTHKEEGGLRRANKLEPRTPIKVTDTSPVRSITLSPAGHILIRTQPESASRQPNGEEQDYLLSLETGEELWRRKFDNYAVSIPGDYPLLFGENRLYYLALVVDEALPAYLMALDIQTGQTLYTTATPLNLFEGMGHVLGNPSRKRLSRNYSALVSAGGREALAIVGSTGVTHGTSNEASGSIFIFDGETGGLEQTVQVDLGQGQHGYLVSSDTKEEFALLSHAFDAPTAITIHKFCAGPDGQFQLQAGGSRVVRWTNTTLRPESLAINPFSGCYALTWLPGENITNGLCVGALTTDPRHAFGQVHQDLQGTDTDAPAGTADNALFLAECLPVWRRVNDKMINQPWLFTKNPRYAPARTDHHVHFLRDDRVLVEVARKDEHLRRRDLRKYKYHVLDFGSRHRVADAGMAEEL